MAGNFVGFLLDFQLPQHQTIGSLAQALTIWMAAVAVA